MPRGKKYGPEEIIPKLRDRLIELRKLREERKSANQRSRRDELTPSERSVILAKTGGKCHICGGEVGEVWHADHVLAHSTGGEHSTDNYLAAHATCNNYRWDYLPEEFQTILKLGVWTRTQIEKGSRIGESIDLEYNKAEAKRIARRKPPDQ